MNLKRIIFTTVAAGLLAAAHVAGAATFTISVDAKDNSTSGGVGLDSHVHFAAGESLSLSVDPNQTWNFSGGDPTYTVNANGFAGATVSLWNTDGTRFDARLGSLIAQIGSGHYFTVGTQYYGQADTSGNLKFYFADSDNDNNIGKVDAVFTFPAVSPVPEPSGAATVSLGLAVIGLTSLSRRRRK